MQNDPRCIGRVRHVRGATITVALEESLVGVTPLWEGRAHPIGQVGSLVIIPQGPTRLLAAVTLVGIAELAGKLDPSAAVQVGDRWLQVQLLGELDAVGRFGRGVTTYPGLDDPVLFSTPEDLRLVYPPPSDRRVRVGSLSAAPDVPLTLDAQSLVTRHAAFVGSTGSGKTSAVASLLQNIIRGGWTSANIVIVDPHGEYAQALAGAASVRSVMGQGGSFLRVPFWALPANGVLTAFSGSDQSATVANRFAELVVAARRKFNASAKWLDVPEESVTSDSPIPFDINDVWYQMDYDNRATYSKNAGAGDPQIEDAGDRVTLRPARFAPYSAGGAAPFKGPFYGHYGQSMERMRARMLDSRYRFLLNPNGDAESEDQLVEVIHEWLGGEEPVSVLDFSGVPAEATDLAVGVILQLLFDLAVHSTTDGIGRPRPVFVLLEEAHRYLGESQSTHLARAAANRIAREGRKYGIGIGLITQRPSELPATALSQVGTIVALRLSNATDQATVKAALPDAVAGLAESLPSLRTGEAIMAGEAVTLPTRAAFDRPYPSPAADDPGLDNWRRAKSPNSLKGAVARWRGENDQAQGEE